MFNKNVPVGGISNKDAETIIGSSVKVEGNFVCEGNIIVDGEVKGKIETNGFLQVGDRAGIVAEVKAGNGKIGGTVKGNVRVAGYLEITSGAKIDGDIHAGSMSVEKGAVLNGRLTMTGDNQAAEEAEAEVESEAEEA